MRRRIAWAVGLALLGGVGWVGAATAKGDKAEKDARPRRHVEVIRAFGGSGGYLGVVLEEVAQDDVARLKLADERGALVKSVEDDTPAARAGLKTGDVVLKYQGENVLSASQLRRLIRETPAGRSVALEVARDGGTRHRARRGFAGTAGGMRW
jgi:C-terminal processing protease CtpA/Prc